MNPAQAIATFDIQISSVIQEVNRLSALVDTLTKRVEELEKRPPRSIQFEHSSHSSSSNRRFNIRELAKEEALTTYNFRAFNDFLDSYEEENPDLINQDQTEYESEHYKEYLELPCKTLLDLEIQNASKDCRDLPGDPDKQIKKALLLHLEERFQEHPLCYDSAWYLFIQEIEEKYKGKHIFN